MLKLDDGGFSAGAGRQTHGRVSAGCAGLPAHVRGTDLRIHGDILKVLILGDPNTCPRAQNL